ncbi:MAG: hypothetical protein RSA10_02860 [Bacilli bacterium]
MNSNYNQGYYPNTGYPVNGNQSDERIIGGAAFPFLLGGVTGAALAPAFWRPGYGYNRPNYYPYPPYPVYPPYPNYYPYNKPRIF